uniref:Uncharacterized protein n=1 Tax=Tanacetum cinerariifolium TaxID=118510 RepID=A0A699J1S7_TANCI|nr:hypothetical protein [Tanacetum cinerariifolium]
MSDTDEERPRKYRKLSDIYKEEYERIRGVTPERSGAKGKTSLLKRSGKKSLKVVSKCNLGKRGRKTLSSVRCEASTSGTKKVSLSRGSKKGTEMVQEEMPKISRLQLGGHNTQITVKSNSLVSTLGVKKVQLAQPAMTFSQSLLTSSNDEIISALGLISLSNGPPASGPGLPQSEPIEHETSVCVTNRNPSEFSSEVATYYMRSC